MERLAGRRVRALLGAALITGSLSGALLASVGPAAAAATVTLYVNGTSGTKTTGCTGPGTQACKTIQQGVTAAEALTGDAVTVTVAAGTYAGGITISAGTLASLTVQGGGESSTTVSGGGTEGDFSLSASTVTISGLSIDTGKAVQGGGVYIGGGMSATLTDDTFSGDSASADGGAVSDWGIATLSDDTFSTDHATGNGGGFTNSYTTATLTDDTFSGDTAGGYGGGVGNWGTSTLTDDTFSDDAASFQGGGFSNVRTGPTLGFATLTDDTFSGDSALFGGGGAFNDGTATVDASIFDGSSCRSTAGSLSGTYDVVTTTTGCAFSTSVTTTRTGLGLTTTLQANGSSGPETLALFQTSPAVDEVPAAACTLKTDERGDPRPGIPDQTSCDAGAYEYQEVSSTVACIPNTKACESMAARPTRSTKVSSDEVTVTTSGRGTFAVGTYRKDPAGVLSSSTGKFFGISLSTGNHLGPIVVEDCNLAGGTALEWWNGHAWEPVLSQTGATYTSTCTTITLGATTTPSLSTLTKLSRLSRFGAVVFAVTGYPNPT